MTGMASGAARRVILLAGILLLGSGGCGQRVVVTVDDHPGDHPGARAEWQALLDRVVDRGGRVDFEALSEREPALDRVLAAIAALERPTTTKGRLAWGLNAYHAMAMKAVLVNGYPTSLDGFFDRGSFYGRTSFLVEGEWRSLQDQYLEGIRSLGEPRVVAAVNGMVAGFPRLRDEAYDPQDLDRQLDEATREFLRDERHVRLDHDRREVWLTPLIQRAREDGLLPRDQAALLRWIGTWRDEPVPEHYRLRSGSFDWSVIHQRAMAWSR